MMFDESSTMDYLAIAFATGHNRPGLFVICAHRRYSLDSVSFVQSLLDVKRTHKRVSVMGKVQVYSIHGLLNTQDANGTSRMALLHTRMS